ncbi:hypothetical protein GCM10023340_25520 [Nocardioides marinquilinus]|uniref:Uncharacterized protein n=1 Tax=Nocardioides marinquilinus TaxID=1210400 RepID=A0ABP9PNT9_9ACTN
MLSIASEGSVLSIGSVGSFASIGSIGSALSIASVGSVMSAGSAWSCQAGGSVLSCQATRSVGSFRADDAWFAAYADGALPRWAAPAVVAGVASVALATWRGLRHSRATASCTRRTIGG